MRPVQLKRLINEAKVLHAINNGAATLSDIVEVTGICHRSIFDITKVLHIRGDIKVERPRTVPVDRIHTFLGDKEGRMEEYLHVDIPEVVRKEKPVSGRIYTCDEVHALIRQHPKPAEKRRWGNYGISGSTLGGAYFDY